MIIKLNAKSGFQHDFAEHGAHVGHNFFQLCQATILL
jgi:hypothetical protein